MTDEHKRYIINESGERTAVILSMAEYDELLEDLHDLAVLAERREEPTLAHEDVVARLKADGLL